MSLRDEIKPKVNKLAELEAFVDSQPNRDEWLEVIFDKQFSTYAIAELLGKHGFKCDWNVVFRFRGRHAG